MMRAAARQLQSPKVRFVGLSFGLHVSVLWLAYVGFGSTLLTTPMSATIVLASMRVASLGPSMHERTGSFRLAVWLAIGVPLALFATGVPLAVLVELTDTGAMTQSALFTPWWLLYFGLMFWHAKSNGAFSNESPDRPPRWVLATALIPLLAGFALVMFAFQLMYLRPTS